MSEIEKLEADAKALEAKASAALTELEDKVKKIFEDLAFRLKQQLHSVNHPAVDAQADAAAQAMADAIATARANSGLADTSASVATQTGPSAPVADSTDATQAAAGSADAGTDASESAAGQTGSSDAGAEADKA